MSTAADFMTNLLPAEDDRLLIELEFLQNLANPSYLHHLAQHGFFDNESFLVFLTYLQYWKQPGYIEHVLFPHSLAVLELLVSNTEFRRELKFPQFMTFVHQQQGLHWMCREPIVIEKSNS